LLARASSELGWLLLGSLCLVIAATPLALWRMRHGTVSAAVAATVLDATVVGSLALVLALTLRAGPGEDRSQVNLIPFRWLLDSLPSGGASPRLPLTEMLANVALFVPLGLAVALRAPRLAMRRLVAGAAVLAISLEVTQALLLRGRAADITDVLVNTFGASIGFGLGRAAHRIWAKSPPRQET
jgi:glycopeptide antibiotics resistance protein